jgi:hypothetical protein
MTRKISNFFNVEGKFKRNNFTFGKEFEFQIDLELKIQELKKM